MIDDLSDFLSQFCILKLVVLLADYQDHNFTAKKKHNDRVVDHEDENDKDEHESHDVPHRGAQIIAKQQHED